MQDAERVLAGLDPEQRAAAEAVRGPVCILAGAGTGKTRAITHRIAYAVRAEAVPAGQLLAVTFTARAAGELRARLRTLGAPNVQARTFHAAALRQLQYFAPRILGGALPDVLDNPLRTVGNAAARARLRVDRTELRDLAAEIDWAKSVLATPEAYPARAKEAGREISTTPDTIATVYAEYEQTKRRSGQIDFADLLLIMSGALEELPDVAEEVRSRYRHFVVDEYQDVSPLQQRLLDAWLGDRTDLCVVGDANQTIYSFAGATPEHLLGFRRRFPDAVVVRLHRDYRSTPQVVALANSLVRGGDTEHTLIGQRPDGPAPSFAEFDDEPAEAAAVAAQCRVLIDSGTSAAEMAVLFRVNAQSEVYEQALAEAGVPYVLRGGERFFDRPEIREARLLLRGAARAAQDRDAALPDAVRGVLASLGWYPDNAPPGGAARERWESLAALVTLADDLLASRPEAHLDELTAELDQRASAQHAPTVQGVTLASLHSAKGLEWDAVFLVGLTDSTVPIQHATTPAQIAEERRLLYVGITRARERLALSWALARSPGQRRGRRPSRFLDGLRPTAARATAPRSKTRAKAPEAEDAELFGRLRIWRKTQAEAQQVPPYVVFSDATLVAIADARPSSRAGLAQISGVGPTKLSRYADPLLDVLGGADPADVAAVEVGGWVMRPRPAAPPPTETAVIVAVPEVEPLVGAHRTQLDGSAPWGVPAHVTVLYPFLAPAQIDDAVLRVLAAAVATVPAFTCTFPRTRWFADELLWLAPDPDLPLRALTAAVWAAFPATPPYSGMHADPIPHLTVAERRIGGLAAARQAERAIAPGLPVSARIERVTLIAGTRAPQSWRTVSTFPLAGRADPQR